MNKEENTTQSVTIKKINHIFEHAKETFIIEEGIFPQNFTPNRIFHVASFGWFNTIEEAKEKIKKHVSDKWNYYQREAERSERRTFNAIFEGR